MGIFDFLKKQPSPSRAPIGWNATFGFPQNWSTKNYLDAYGSVGWVYASVSRIAQSVGEAEFHLYKGKKENAQEVESIPFWIS